MTANYPEMRTVSVVFPPYFVTSVCVCIISLSSHFFSYNIKGIDCITQYLSTVDFI